MELRVITDLEKSLPAVIDFNFAELKAELTEKLAYYNALVVTEDSIKTGKEERAKLNKLKAAIDSRRKDVKAACLAPYEAFEAQCKELTGMIDTAALSIDGQVKAFEAAEKEKKRAALMEVYEKGVGEYGDLVPFERLLDPKWLNKSVSLAAASGELCARMQKIVSDAKVLKAMRLDCEAQVMDAYFTALDMSAALAEKARFEARQEQFKKLAEEPAKAPAIGTAPVHGELTEAQARQVADAMDHAFAEGREMPKTVKVIFYNTTAAFRSEMKTLTEKHNIRYGGIQ